MRSESKKDLRSLALYLLICFVATYAVEFVVCRYALEYVQPALIGVMFIPIISTAIVCRGLTREKAGVNWKPNIKKSFGWFLAAWFSPALFTLLGAVVYFALFPKMFSPEMEGLTTMLAQQGAPVENGTIQGMPLSMFIIIQSVTSVIIVPFINAIAAVGEEVGWRGFLTPLLTRLTGRKLALILSGVIWGLWHAPLILLIGYEYGTGYFGEPWLGIILFCYITTLLGVLLTYLYDRTNSILAPALFHGAFNAIASVPLFFSVAEGNNMLLGPAPNGLVSSIPLMIAAVLLFFLTRAKAAEPAAEEEEAAAEISSEKGE